MKSIILAAGMGTRLRPLTEDAPKCLTEVNGKPILVNMLENLESLGITHTRIVIGYKGDKIRKEIGNSFKNMTIDYVVQDRLEQTNTSYALLLGLNNLEIQDYLLVLEGDVFFEKNLLKKFLKSGTLSSTIVEKYNPNLDGSFVDIKQGKIIDWIHKSKRQPDFAIEDKFKTVNIHRFNKDFLENYLKPILSQHVRDYNGSEPLEYVMQDIVRNNGKIYSFEVGNLKWFEIDDLNELKIAEEIFKPKLSLEKIRSFHGGYWKYDLFDFHYLVNCHFPTKEFFDKIKEKLPELVTYYPSDKKIIAENLSKWKDKLYFNKENLIVTNGSSEAIKAMNQIMDKITVPIPTFNEYTELPPEKINLFQLKEEDKFKINVDELILEIRNSNSNFVVINNPNNPTGIITPRQDIIKILETGVNLIVDEAFIDFSVEDSVEDLVERYENLIIIKTITKTMGLAGLRFGYILTKNNQIKGKLREILPCWNINSIAEYFIDSFLDYEKEYFESIEKTKKERSELFNELKNISFLEPYETGANFVFCKTKTSSRELANFLYEDYNIILRSELNQKILKSDNYIRIAVRTQEDNQKLISALKDFEKEKI
tara:strand:+ start:24042 stop:25832 length:1791 start_codon:yes stop_codon:yes gene_type:complete